MLLSGTENCISGLSEKNIPVCKRFLFEYKQQPCVSYQDYSVRTPALLFIDDEVFALCHITLGNINNIRLFTKQPFLLSYICSCHHLL